MTDKNKKEIIENGVLKQYAGYQHNYKVPQGIRIIDRFAFCGNYSIETVMIRGEVSEGLALPVEVLEKYTDIDSLKDGDRVFTLNGHQICGAYIPEEMELDMKKKTLVRYRGRKSSPERVCIPLGTKSIGEQAFMDCTRITEVYIPDTVITIGKRAFYGCSKLKKFTIPDSVVTIGEEAFAHCLARPVLPKALKESEELIIAAKDYLIQDGVLT